MSLRARSTRPPTIRLRRSWVAGPLLVLALVAAACSSSGDVAAEPTAIPTAAAEPTAIPTTEPEPTPAPEPTAAPSPTTAPEPSPAELAAQRQSDVTDQIQAAVDAWREGNGAPGVSAAVLIPGYEPVEVASGVRDLVTQEPVTSDDYFRIASVTKPMTSTLVLQMVEDGLIDLDEPVSTYLGDWLGEHPSEDDITVRQLLNHTNGLIEYALDLGFFLEAGKRIETAYTPDEILEFLGRQDPLFAPGTDYAYETGGFVTAGLLIELLRENSAAAEMRANVFDPAGAGEIYLTPEEFPPTEVVHGYNRAEMYLALTFATRIADEFGLTVNEDEPVIDNYVSDQAVLQSAGWTGGGNEAQLIEVARIMRAMFNGTLLKPESVELMLAPALPDVSYGLGIDVGAASNGATVYSHGGGVPGFRSQAGWMPELDVAYAFSANLIPLPAGAGVNVLRDRIAEIATEALETP